MVQTFVPNPNLADGKPAGVSDADISLKADITYVDSLVASGGTGTANDKNYVFNQAIPDTTWTVTHNLGKFPAVSVVDSTGKRVVGDELHVSTSQVVLTFVAAFSGKAYCN